MYGVVRYLFISRLAGSHLRKLSRELVSPERVVELAFNFRYRDPIASAILRRDIYIDIRPIQVYEEILELARLIDKLKPRAILEIGTANGGTLFIWCRLAAEDATIISIDLPGGPFGGGYPRWRAILYKYFRKPRQKLYLIRADSHDPITLTKVKKILGGQKLDFLFIDGDHSYEGVKKDFEMYSPLVRPGGIIAFHDIVPHPPETRCEVSKFWNEVKIKYSHMEIVKDRNQRWAGIGIIFKE